MDVSFDFHGDFRIIVERVLKAHGVVVDPSESYYDPIYRFHANKRRLLAVQPYYVREAAELRCRHPVPGMRPEFVEKHPLVAKLHKCLTKPG